MRRFRHFALILMIGLVVIVAACGDVDGSEATEPPNTSAVAHGNEGQKPSVAVLVTTRETPSVRPNLAGDAITNFGIDLFAEVRSADAGANFTVSPASVAIALAMLEPGTVGAASEQLMALLDIAEPVAFHASMNALEQSLESRTPQAFGDDDDPGEITIAVANATFLQEGYPFKQTYLDVIGANYGPVLREVDFGPDPDAVAHEINAFVADATNDQIVDLIGDGVIGRDTVLALVNALYLKASWLETFDEEATRATPFSLLDGSQSDVPMMNGTSSLSAAGDGWIGASKIYVGGLSAQFILPDEGRFDEIAGSWPKVLADFDRNATVGAQLAVPRFKIRSSNELTPALQSLGLVAPYAEGSLLGIADDPRLVLDKVIHEAFVAMDEQGTEAAAATVLLVRVESAPPGPPVPVILDRPFLYRIVDDESGATLFIGQVTDPGR